MCDWITYWCSWITAIDWHPVVPSIIGGLIGGGFAFWGGWRAYKYNLKHSEIQKQKKIDGVLQSIRYELEILGQVYKAQAGGLLEKQKDKAGEPFSVHFSLTEKYFIVYPNNTDVVGQIDDPDLVKSIIVTYNKANFLIEMFRINNLYLGQQTEIEKMGLMTVDTLMLRQMNIPLQNLRNRLVEHKQLLIQSHMDLVTETDNLLAKISDYRKRHPIKAI